MSETGRVDALTLEDVRKVYRTDVMKKPQVALDGLTCRFPTGACTGLLGHNGAGKTTTIRMILGLVRPDRGRILFEGQPLTTASKRWIGYMPEVNKLPAALTPLEVLDHHLQLFMPESARTAAERRRLVNEQIERVGLGQHRKKRLGKMSKGMARRLAWAQATIHAPRLLVLDEPSSGLDPLGRREMLAWIEQEKTRGTTILLCTHELLQVQSLCDRIYVLNRGKLVFSSAADHPGEAVRQRYVVRVSGVDAGALQRYAQRLPPWVEAQEEGFVRVLTFAGYAAAAEWLKALLAEGHAITRFGDETSLGEEELLPFFKGAD
jgi:ABC-2 type transport system ATP-binding protein